MTVSSIASIAASITNSLANQKTNSSGTSGTGIVASVANLLSASSGASDGGDSLLSVLLADTTGQQTQQSSLRAATQNVAETGAMVNTASDGVSEIAQVLDQMQELAQEASAGDLSSDERTTLNTAFQALSSVITDIANGTSFEGQSLLDGSFNSQALQQANGDNNDSDNSFSIADLRSSALFGSGNVDLLSASDAQAASQAVSTAQNTVSDQQTTLDDLSQGIDLALASLQTASQNQDAANSTLTDNDLLSTSNANSSPQAQLQAQSQQALVAQTSKLPNNILTLLAE